MCVCLREWLQHTVSKVQSQRMCWSSVVLIPDGECATNMLKHAGKGMQPWCGIGSIQPNA